MGLPLRVSQTGVTSFSLHLMQSAAHFSPLAKKTSPFCRTRWAGWAGAGGVGEVPQSLKRPSNVSLLDVITWHFRSVFRQLLPRVAARLGRVRRSSSACTSISRLAGIPAE